MRSYAAPAGLVLILLFVSSWVSACVDGSLAAVYHALEGVGVNLGPSDWLPGFVGASFCCTGSGLGGSE